MGVEPKRGCGFRKVGGLYLVGAGLGMACDRLPYPITVCPTCGEGIKPSRGIRWMDGAKFFGDRCEKLVDELRLAVNHQENLLSGCHKNCCALCFSDKLGRVGLMWVGEKYYRSPEIFIAEAETQGVCKRIPAVPKDVEIGKTWVLLAHPKAVWSDDVIDELVQTGQMTGGRRELQPAIFYAFRPTAIEMIVTDQTSEEELDKLKKRRIVPVVVPYDDPDHNPGAKKKVSVPFAEMSMI